MRSGLDFSSWQALVSTLLGLSIIALVTVGIRLLVMQTVQQRRERANRQINERLRTLIAAYKTLGGSFTGNLEVDPAHRREGRLSADRDASPTVEPPGSERRRRVRDAVEAALSDIILLGTEAQVELAARAATDLAAGRAVHTADIVVSLRDFIRDALDLEPVRTGLAIPSQGPSRPPSSSAKGAAKGNADGRGGGGGGAGGGGAGGGGAGFGADPTHHDDPAHHG